VKNDNIIGRFAIVLLICVFALAGVFLWHLMGVLKVCSAPNAVKITADFKDAFELLNASQTSWLTVVGFFATIFGLVVPVAGYLLQRQSLKDEAEALKNEVKSLAEKCEQMKSEAASERQKLQTERRELLNETYFAIARNDERILFDDADSILAGAEKTIFNLANFVLQFEHTLDAYVRAGKTIDCLRVIRCGQQVSQYLISNRHDAWEAVVRLLRQDSRQFVGLMYNDVLSEAMKDYPVELDWLRKFFGQF